ncbi:acyl-CoA dehydrogenase family protein [Acanthopleuribacter pedis]|uniref:Acyl-CoA dehydrogenase family protein n=1 Tax=Acanthopleuribacter pedis TaxID=442870 RepID=A0A8J7U3R7_9BACT|nr:acyl-CoA dehydrogenase family protein [Acanthopleuribacter pedis]MBO1319892.1 acyl-CoA dehydrogenase family protein [Acanthopleuribacter pedis]
MRSPYFTVEHDVFREGVRKFVAEEVAPNADLWERDHMIPREIWRRMGELGYLGINHSEAHGGSEADFFYSVVFLEELARGNMGGFTAAVSVQQYMATAHIAKAGSEDIKQQFLVPSIEGQAVGALAISEPDTGSDVANIRTRARREGDEYVIDGAKMFITNGYYADFVVVACRTGEDGASGISLIVVETTRPGFKARKLDKIGWRCSDTAEMSFDGVRVPVSNLVGKENHGFYYIMESFQLERLVGAVGAIGAADYVLEFTGKYIRERQAFGRPVARFQTIRHDMADMVTELAAARQLVYHTAWLYDQGEVPVLECSMIKLKAAELCNEIIDRCLQCHGGYGYMEEYPIARAYRDTRVGTIAGGTSAIMREIIAKMVLDETQYETVYKDRDQAEQLNKAASDPAAEKAEAAPKQAAEKAEAAAPATGDGSSIPALFARLPDRFSEALWSGEDLVFHFNIEGEGGGEYTVKVAEGKATSAAGLSGAADCVVDTAAKLFLDLEAGQANPQTAFMTGQLRVSSIPHVLTFMRIFQLG